MSKLTSKDKSIILQVVLKEVYSTGLRGAKLMDEIADVASGMFALHESFDAGGQDELDIQLARTKPRSSGGGGGGGAPRSSGAPSYGGGGYTPKYDKSKLPVVAIDFFGTGDKIAFQDQRPAKREGAYKPTAADFQSIQKFDLGQGDRNIPLWTWDARNGQPVADTLALLDAEGISYVADEFADNKPSAY